MGNGRLIVGGSAGYFIAALFNSILVVIKETNEGVHEWLVQVFSHHWLGHGILTIIVFVVATFLVYSVYKSPKELSDSLANKLIVTIVTGTVLSILIIAGFFLANF